jgi:hypothetical protein
VPLLKQARCSESKEEVGNNQSVQQMLSTSYVPGSVSGNGVYSEENTFQVSLLSYIQLVEPLNNNTYNT